MKNSYADPAQVLLDVDRLLAQTPAQWRHSPLDEVAGLLFRARHFRWIGIYLLVDEAEQRQALRGPAPDFVQARGAGGLDVQVPIRKGIRVLGMIEVAGGDCLHPDDRRLLKDVARRLGDFLSGKGKWLVRKIRESAREMQDPGDSHHAAAGTK